MRYLKRMSRLFGLVNLALVVALIAVVSSLIAPKRAEREDAGVVLRGEAGPRSTVTEDAETQYGDPALILKRDVFGVSQKESRAKVSARAPKAIAKKPKKREPLPFRLIGTVASDEGDSYAILEDTETKTQDIYGVGATIKGARIDRIEQNKVVVLNMGVREVLELVLAGQQTTSVRTVAKSEEPVKATGSKEVVRTASNGERQINSRASASQLNGAAYSLLSEMELSPHVVNGETTGLRISGLKDSTMAQLAGLRDGDVLQSVNGQSVMNRRKALQVLKKARKLGSAQLELSRGQETKSLAFRLGAW